MSTRGGAQTWIMRNPPQLRRDKRAKLAKKTPAAMPDTAMPPLPGGLSEAEAQLRLDRDGPNELPVSRPRGVLRLLRDIVSEPMFLLLVACGAIYMALGDRHEAFMLLGFVFVVMGITFVQQRRTEHSLEALRDLSSPRALVVRDGRARRIAGRELVCGDIVLLAEGDRVPGDMQLVDSSNLAVDESLLTGESAPVPKQITEVSDLCGVWQATQMRPPDQAWLVKSWDEPVIVPACDTPKAAASPTAAATRSNSFFKSI